MFLDQGASANLNTCRHAGYVPPPVTRPQLRREGAARPPRGQNCDLGHGCLEHTSRATWPLLARATVQSDVAFRGGRKGAAVATIYAFGVCSCALVGDQPQFTPSGSKRGVRRSCVRSFFLEAYCGDGPPLFQHWQRRRASCPKSSLRRRV